MTREEAINNLKFLMPPKHMFERGHKAVEMAIAALKNQSTWNPYPETFPAKSGDYLVTIEGATESTVLEWCMKDCAWYDIEYFEYPVTAWQPLPQPYKEKEK